jgi:hypothetical protein
MAAAGLMPLCPTCLDRVPAWTAAKCPGCDGGSPVAECDLCQKSRAGAFLPEDAKSGGAQRFVCVDCMEEQLETNVSDSMFNSVLACGLAIVAVRYYGRFSWLPAATIALFVAAVLSLGLWARARMRQRRPAKHAASVWGFLDGRVAAALKKRPGAR